MAIDLKGMVQKALASVFGLGPEFVKDAVYFRPASFNSSTGLTTSTEIAAPCKALILNYRPLDFGLVGVQPGDEKVLVRSSELASISNPGAGDHVTETVSGQRRDVLSGRLDPSGEFWTFQTTRTMNNDRGDLTAATLFEDWGDLMAATDFDDWGALV